MNHLSFISTKYILVYTAVIEGMYKRLKSIKIGINFTIPNRAVVQVAIKAGSNK